MIMYSLYYYLAYTIDVLIRFSTSQQDKTKGNNKFTIKNSDKIQETKTAQDTGN